MTRFRKKPVEIEARQWDGTADGASPIIDWILKAGVTARYECSDPERCAAHDGDCPHFIAVETLEGCMRASLGDWIIRGVKGEFYPCKPDIFEATYEPADGKTRFARSASVEDTTLFLEGVPFPFHITEEGPSVEQFSPKGGGWPALYGVTITVMVQGEVAGIVRETRPASAEELLDLARQRLKAAQADADEIDELVRHDTMVRALADWDRRRNSAA